MAQLNAIQTAQNWFNQAKQAIQPAVQQVVPTIQKAVATGVSDVQHFAQPIVDNIHQNVIPQMLGNVGQAAQQIPQNIIHSQPIQNLSRGILSAEKNVPLYGQLNAGIRETVAPIMRNFTTQQEVNKYTALSQPNNAGIGGNIARFVGQQVPYIPLMMATEGVTNPVTSRLAGLISEGKTLTTAALSGAAKTATQFAPFGWMGVLDYAKTPQDRINNVLKSTLDNIAFGGAVGGAGGAIKYTANKVFTNLKAVLMNNHNLDEAQAGQVVKQYSRNFMGQFDTPSTVKANKNQIKVRSDVNNMLQRPENTSVYYSDLNKALGLPEKFNPQSGFINFGAKAEEEVKPVTDTQQYLTELKAQQDAAKNTGQKGIVQKGKDFLSTVKSALVDRAAPIEDAISQAEKQGKFQVRPTNDIRLQIDRVLRSKGLAGQFAEDNGLTNVIKQAPDIHALDQYMIAKQASRVGELGMKTGRNAEKDVQLVKDLAPQYEGYAKQVNDYSQKLLDYSVKSGLVPQELAIKLKEKYPEYVPLNRIFNELETNGYKGVGSSLASLSKQTVVQSLKGSERAIQSPIESLLLKTQDAFKQGERNIAAKQLASYKDLPGMGGLIQEVPKGQNAPAHGFSYLDNGVKRMFSTTPEIASAAKNLDAQQMNVVTKILSVPTRALQLGATGLNTPFAATNLLKDQIDGFINSNKALRTSIANPVNFLQALGAAVKHNDLFDEVNRNAGMQTSFDISREQPNLVVNKIRAGKSIGSQIAYTAKHPADIVRFLEDTIGRTEELTRIQQYKGTYAGLLKEGRTPEDARLLAAQAARNNTANFARHGDIGKIINYVIPFFNAGIQGSRAFINAARTNPAGTGAKLAISLFLPMAASTLWNTTDPARKAIYDDIQQSDKEKNIIIIPDGATKDANGKWNVIKIPMPSGLAPITSLVRRGIEQVQGGNAVGAKEVFDALVGSTTPFDTSSPAKFIGGLVPQGVKPFVEGTYNTNLYTGNPIVPPSMKNLPVDQQVKPNTSPLAKLAGNVLGVSPLIIENGMRTALGGVGGQLLGQNPIAQLQGRFTQASGGGQENQQFTDIAKYQQEQAVTSQKQKAAITNAATILLDKNADPQQKAKLIGAIRQNKQLFTALKNEVRDQVNGVTAADRAVQNLSTVEQAKYIRDQVKALSLTEKKAKVIEYIKKGMLTPNVIKAIGKLQ